MPVLYIRDRDGNFVPVPALIGPQGEPGAQGIQGIPGKDGEDGKSAYRYAQDGGYIGTEAEFAEKLAQEIPAPYILPPATPERLGGMIPGGGLNIDADGRVSVDDGTEWVEIEKTVLAEHTVYFTRTAEPDGTPYRLDAIKAVIKMPPGQNTGMFVGRIWADGDEGAATGSLMVTTTVKSNPAGSVEWYRSTVLANVTPLYGLYECWAANGQQGGDMTINLPPNGDSQAVSCDRKIKQLRFEIYGDIGFVAGTEILIMGVRSNA